MDHTPYTALAVLFEDGADLLGFCEVGLYGVDLSAGLVVGRGVLGESILGNLGDAVEGMGVRVVEVVDGDNLKLASLLECVDGMGACVGRSDVSGRKG